MTAMNHHFHLVTYSPWPILSALNLINIGISVVAWMTIKNQTIILSITLEMVVMIQWWRDVIREALYQGHQTTKVKKGLTLGMLLFILSEIFFFFSFFWTFFYLSLNPDPILGMSWPPAGVQTVSFLDIPLLNTMILLSSGIFITASHYNMNSNKIYLTKINYKIAIMMGIYFSMIQIYEYTQMPFDLSSSSFGSVFYILTGFHGFHVMVGIIFIWIQYKRLTMNELNSISMQGMEYSIWYWHFVDMVWLFLYTFIYWWGM